MSKKHYIILALILFISLNPLLLMLSAMIILLLIKVAAVLAFLAFPMIWAKRFLQFEIDEAKGYVKRRFA